MKLSTICTIALSSALLFSSCKKDTAKPEANTNTKTDESAKEVLTANAVTYEASGSFSFTNVTNSITNSYTHQYVKINYKDQSQLWPDTYYTYLTFYNSNSQAAAEMLTFVLLGKDLPKTGTYKTGPLPIAVDGIKAADKLSSDEIAIMAVSNSMVSKRNAATTIKVLNENGKITITTSDEINVYDNLMGDLKGKCKSISLVRNPKKV